MSNSFFVWQSDKKTPACHQCEAKVKPVKPIIPAAKPQAEKFAFKYGKIKIEVKNAKEIEVHEDKTYGTLTLRLK